MLAGVNRSSLFSPPSDDLELSEEGGDSRLVAARDLRPDTKWGPYPGILQSEGSKDDQEAEVRAPPLAKVMIQL